MSKIYFVPEAASYIQSNVDERLSYSDAVIYALWSWHRSAIIDVESLHRDYEEYLRERANQPTKKG